MNSVLGLDGEMIPHSKKCYVWTSRNISFFYFRIVFGNVSVAQLVASMSYVVLDAVGIVDV